MQEGQEEACQKEGGPLRRAGATGLCALALGASLIACGAEEEVSVSTPSAANRVRASALIEAQNEKVRAEYDVRKQAQVPTADEQAATRDLEDFYEILGMGRDTTRASRSVAVYSQPLCALMSEDARELTIDYARRSSGLVKEWDCEGAVDLLVLRSERFGGLKRAKQAEVIGVNAEGDRAMATIRFGGGALTSVPMVREGGEWKLAASPTP